MTTGQTNNFPVITESAAINPTQIQNAKTFCSQNLYNWVFLGLKAKLASHDKLL